MDDFPEDPRGRLRKGTGDEYNLCEIWCYLPVDSHQITCTRSSSGLSNTDVPVNRPIARPLGLTMRATSTFDNPTKQGGVAIIIRFLLYETARILANLESNRDVIRVDFLLWRGC